MTRFNMLADKATYLSGAIAGNAYRGSECNLAFRRQLFFDNNGFTESVGLHHGIDDIFLNRIVRDGNYGVELSGQAQTGYTVPARGSYRNERVRHEFTGRKLSKGSRRLMGLGSLCMWLWLAATVAAGVMLWPAVLPLCVLVAAGIVWIGVTAAAWCAAAKVLHVPVSGWMMPVYLFVRPLTTLWMRLAGHRHRSANYTWAKPV